MANYTLRQAIGDQCFIGDPGNVSFLGVWADQDFEGTDGFTFTNTPGPGAYDIAYSLGGNMYGNSGPWALTTSNPGSGTSSLVIPASGYFVPNSLSSASYGIFQIRFKLRLASLPSNQAPITGIVGSSGNPNAPIRNVVLIGSDGKITFDHVGSKSADAYTATSVSSALTAGVWHEIVVTAWYGQVWVTLDGVVEQIRSGFIDLDLGSSETHNPTIFGSAIMNAAGAQIDDWTVLRGPALNLLWVNSYTPANITRAAERIASPLYKDRTPPTWNQSITVRPGATFWADTTDIHISMDDDGLTPQPDMVLSDALARDSYAATIMGSSRTGSRTNPPGGGGGSTRPSSGFLYPRGQG